MCCRAALLLYVSVSVFVCDLMCRSLLCSLSVFEGWFNKGSYIWLFYNKVLQKFVLPTVNIWLVYSWDSIQVAIQNVFMYSKSRTLIVWFWKPIMLIGSFDKRGLVCLCVYQLGYVWLCAIELHNGWSQLNPMTQTVVWHSVFNDHESWIIETVIKFAEFLVDWSRSVLQWMASQRNRAHGENPRFIYSCRWFFYDCLMRRLALPLFSKWDSILLPLVSNCRAQVAVLEGCSAGDFRGWDIQSRLKIPLQVIVPALHLAQYFALLSFVHAL